MEWNYDMESCPLDTRVKLLSEDGCFLLPQMEFEGTITYNYSREYKTRGKLFVGDGDYFYRSAIVAWKKCDENKHCTHIGTNVPTQSSVPKMPKEKIEELEKLKEEVLEVCGGIGDALLTKFREYKPTELSDVIDKLNEVIRKVNEL